MREFLRIAGINIYDVLEEKFESPLLKGALALDAVLGANLGPRSNNSVLALLHRLSGQAAGNDGLSLPEGGMGAISEAMAAAARAAGATIRTGSPVARITLEGDAVSGVELENGEKIAAGTVVSNADPARTLLGLLGARHLETGFVHRVRHIRMKGMAAKLHLALDALPAFARLPAELAGERLVISPDLVYLEHAFDHAKYGQCSPDPALEITDSLGARQDARAGGQARAVGDRAVRAPRPARERRRSAPRAARTHARRAGAPRARPCAARSSAPNSCCPRTSSANSASRAATGTTASSRSTSS